MISESLLEIRSHDGPDYELLTDYQPWRVALMTYTPELLPEKIHRMQKHITTDEVFVHLAGHCILFLGEGREEVTGIRYPRRGNGTLQAVQREKGMLALAHL